jgi:hypothetical protein
MFEKICLSKRLMVHRDNRPIVKLIPLDKYMFNPDEVEVFNKVIRFWHHIRQFFSNTLTIHNGEIEFHSRRGVPDTILCDQVCQ